jgi:DNA repair protein RecO (recombination protein O)
MTEKGYKVEGIVIKRINIGEADKLITFFTKQKGKVVCLAKGIRKIFSKRAPSLELFNQVSMYVVKGKSLDLIAEVKTLHNFSGLQKKLTLLSNVYYLIELIDRLTAENQENRHIYQLLLATLEQINKQQKVEENQIIEFQTELLTNLGFGLPTQSGNRLDWYIEKILERKINSKKFLKAVSNY